MGTHVPTSQRDLIFHMEHIILIRFGRMVQRATLTFTKYNRMKDEHRERALDEREAYDYDTDIFSKLDRLVVRMEKIPEGSLTRVHLQSMSDRRGLREDHSMKKLGRLLGEDEEEDELSAIKKQHEVKEEPEEEKPEIKLEKEKVRDHFPERDVKKVPEEKIVIEPKDLSQVPSTPMEEGEGEQEVDDSALQEYVNTLLETENVKASDESLRHHIEHIVMIRLGRMIQAHSLHTKQSLWTKYTKIKVEYRKLMKELVAEEIFDNHNEGTDIFARLDNAMAETKRSNPKAGYTEDQLIAIEVSNLLQQTKVPISQNDLIYHMEHVVLIRFGFLVKQGTLTFHKYNTIKETHRNAVKEDVASYGFNGDVFARVDIMIVRREKVLTGHTVRVDYDGSRVDTSMRTLSRMLDERAGILRTERAPVRPPSDSSAPDSSESDLFGKLDTEYNTKGERDDEADSRIQRHVRFMLEGTEPPATEAALQQHIEHVILIKLGKMSTSGALTFDSYTATKSKHRHQIRERLRNKEIASYDFDSDVYGRIDAKMVEEEANASRFGTLTRRDRDRIIQTQVDILLHKEHLLVNEDTLQYHIEYILLIKLCRMLKEGTLTYEKFQRMKMRHREDIRIKLRRKEIMSYDFDRDVYGRLDAAMEDELRKMAVSGKSGRVEVPLTVIAEEATSPSASPAAKTRAPASTSEEEVSFVVHLDTQRIPKSSPEQDAVVQRHVQFLIDETQPPVKPRKLQHHIEHVIMIRLGSLLHDGHLSFQAYMAEKDKLRAELMTDFESYDTEADIYARLDQDLMTQTKRQRKQGEPEPDKDSIICQLVAELLREAKVPAGNRNDLRYHEEHILLIKLGSYLKAGTLTFQKYTALKNKHHATMRQKLMDNEIEYYSFDTDIFGRLDKLILIEIEIIIKREKEEAEKLQAEREARWAAEKAQQEQEKKDAIERAKKRREEKEAREAKEAAELAERQKAEEAAAEAERQERLAKEAEEQIRLEQEKREKEEKAALWRAQREAEEEEKREIERLEREKVKDYFPEQRSLRKKQEEKIVIKPNLRAAAKFGGGDAAKAAAEAPKATEESVTVTTQFVETTQVVTESVVTESVASGEDPAKLVKWEVLVSGEQGELENIQEALTSVELEKQEQDGKPTWTLKLRSRSGSDADQDDVITTGMITAPTTQTKHSTSLVTNVSGKEATDGTDRFISLAWSTATPASPKQPRKQDH